MKRPFSDQAGVVALPPIIYALPLFSGILVNAFFPLHFLNSPWQYVLGWPLLLLGVVLAIWGRQTMIRAGTQVNPRRPTTSIVTEGPFRFSRNPLYVSLTGLYVGVACLFNSLWSLLLLPVVLLVMQWGVILREERYLEHKFGKVYLDYKAKVRRWV